MLSARSYMSVAVLLLLDAIGSSKKRFCELRHRCVVSALWPPAVCQGCRCRGGLSHHSVTPTEVNVSKSAVRPDDTQGRISSDLCSRSPAASPSNTVLCLHRPILLVSVSSRPLFHASLLIVVRFGITNRSPLPSWLLKPDCRPCTWLSLSVSHSQSRTSGPSLFIFRDRPSDTRPKPTLGVGGLCVAAHSYGSPIHRCANSALLRPLRRKPGRRTLAAIPSPSPSLSDPHTTIPLPI